MKKQHELLHRSSRRKEVMPSQDLLIPDWVAWYVPSV